MKTQRPIGKDVPSMKNIIGSLPISDFKLYCRAVVTGSMEPAQKQAVDQWTRTEDLKIILHSHSFLNKCCWENRIFAYIRLKLDSHILLCT